MKSESHLQELLATSRRRRISALVFDQAAIALTIGMAGAVLLLLLGTQILDWYWPFLLFAVAFGIGVFRLRNRLPAPYRLLQEIDGRLHLKDALSTAYYFEVMERSGRSSAAAREAQRNEAEDLARSTNPVHAIPYVLPRSTYAAVFALVAAASLFGVRYGVRRSLDLRPPITEAVLDFFRPSKEMVRAWENPPQSEAENELMPSDEPEPKQSKFDPNDQARLATVETEATGDDLTADTNRPAEESSDPWNSATSEGDSAEAANSMTPPGAEQIDLPEGGENSPQLPEAESDLLRKMQDAFANLMSKLKIPPQAGKGRRMTSSKQATDEGGEKKTAKQARMSPQGDQMQTASQQGEQAREGGQQSAAGQADSPGEKSDRPGQQSSRTGAGQQNGLKQIKAAQQLEAMGELEEILGRRAENIKGEVMVEVSSGPQRLRTDYTDTAATHRAAGAEIHRDQVPLALQPYVQRYFEEIRKQPPAER